GRSKYSPELILPTKRVIQGSRRPRHDRNRRRTTIRRSPPRPSPTPASLHLLYLTTEIGPAILAHLIRDHRDRCRTTFHGGPPRPSSAATRLCIAFPSTENGRTILADLDRDHRNRSSATSGTKIPRSFSVRQPLPEA